MRYLHRELEKQIVRARRDFPAVVLTGPRRAGKTCLLRRLFPKASYFLLEDPDIVARLRADPHGFLDAVKTPVILDEVQNVPEVFAHVRARIDRQPRRRGQWLLTGSQEAPLMQGVTESMAGRGGAISLIECKAARTVTPSDAAPMQRLAAALKQKRPRATSVEMHLVHQPPQTPAATRAVAPGVRAWAWQEFAEQI